MLELNCPTHFVYGQHDWMDSVVGREVSKELRDRGVHSTHYICPDAGHQLFMENAQGFYQIVLKMTGIAGNVADDTPSPSS
jgi:pimeloyl-ACP methyl ester carboxylesterase